MINGETMSMRPPNEYALRVIHPTWGGSVGASLDEPTVAQPQTNSARADQLRKPCALAKMTGAAFSLANRITAMTMPTVAATASSHGNAWINHADAAEL
jgi:hypothetical protein